jgi:hypothetical protein
MKLARFQALLRCYGARLPRWPEAEPAGACALLETSAHARQLLEAAAVLDDALDRVRMAQESAAGSAREREAMLTRLRHYVSIQIANNTPARAAR